MLQCTPSGNPSSVRSLALNALPALPGPRDTLTTPASIQALGLPLPLEKLLAKIVAMSANATCCFVGDTYLSQVIGMSRCHTWRLVKELAERGLIALDYVPSPLDPCQQLRRLTPRVALPLPEETPRFKAPALPEFTFTLEEQTSGDPWRTVRPSESLSLPTEEKAKSKAASQVPNTESVSGTQRTLDGQATECGPAAAAVSCKQVGEGRKPLDTSRAPLGLPEMSPGATRLMAAGVDLRVAADLAERCDLARIEGAIARMKREGKGPGWAVSCLRNGWAVSCLRNGWPVDTPPAPRMPHKAPQGDSADWLATQAMLAAERQAEPLKSKPAEDAAYEAMKEKQRLASLGTLPHPRSAEPPAAGPAIGRARRDPQLLEVAA